MCENLVDLLNSCQDSQDEITYISVRNKILIGIGGKWSFNDIIGLISEYKIEYCRYKILVEILERRDGWNKNIPQLIDILQVKDEKGAFHELKLSMIYLITLNFDPLDEIIISKFTVFTGVLNEIFDKVQIGSLKFLQRNIFFTAMAKLTEAYATIKANVKDDIFTLDFCLKICNQIRGEKDPRNLLLMFPLLKNLLIFSSNSATNAADLCNTVSQILLTYYPINFNPPKNAPQSITETDLTLALNNALSFNSLWKYVIDVLIDGLYGSEHTDSESLDFLDKNVKTLVYCLPHYGYECVLKYFPQVVEALSTECFLSASDCKDFPINLLMDEEYEIGTNLQHCKIILSLPKWTPNKKQELLSEILQIFLQNTPPSIDHAEEIWKNISFLLEMAKNSILSNNNDLTTSIHIIKTVVNSSPESIFHHISEFLHKLIAQMPIKVETMGTIAQLLAISFLNNKLGKITAYTAGKVSEILKFIGLTICDDVEQFIDITKVLTTLALPDTFVHSVCQKINQMPNFNVDSEEIILNLSEQQGATPFLASLFEPISESKLDHGESLTCNIENANVFFNYLSANTSLLRYSYKNLSHLYNKLNDDLSLKRFCFTWTLSVIAIGDPNDFYWYNYAKSLASMDQTLELWICQIISNELFSKTEFLHLLDDICRGFSSKILGFILNTYRDNICKLLFIPWLERFYDLKSFNSAKLIFQELNGQSQTEDLQLSLIPILFKHPLENLLSINVQLFGLVKHSEITSNDHWSNYLQGLISAGNFGQILGDLSLMLDELCPLRIIPGEKWQIVLDTWANPENYRKSQRITETMDHNLTSVLLDKIYHIDSSSCVQRISLANFILSNIDEYLTGSQENHSLDAQRCLIRLLSSIPAGLIDRKWINALFQSPFSFHLDWDDLRLLCLLAKLARHKLLNSLLQTSVNLKLIVNYCTKRRSMALSRTISLLIIKDIWNLVNSSLEEDLCRIVAEYVYKCGKDPHKRVRRMALSARQTVKLNISLF